MLRDMLQPFAMASRSEPAHWDCFANLNSTRVRGTRLAQVLENMDASKQGVASTLTAGAAAPEASAEHRPGPGPQKERAAAAARRSARPLVRDVARVEESPDRWPIEIVMWDEV